MTTSRPECPECGSDAVLLRDVRKRYGQANRMGECHLALVPVAADRTYSCRRCGCVFTNRETLQDAFQECLAQ
jgi:uncharacterized Zn finger protein